jgi:hypothetical protein
MDRDQAALCTAFNEMLRDQDPFLGARCHLLLGSLEPRPSVKNCLGGRIGLR